MTEIVVDASVVVKWYVPERQHGNARAVRDGYLDGVYDLFAPSLMPFEVVNALKYGGHYDAEDRLTAAATSLSKYGIELVPFRELGPVAAVATALEIPVYDASYLSLAETRDSIVYTADDRLLDRIAGSSYEERAAHIEAYPDDESGPVG